MSFSLTSYKILKTVNRMDKDALVEVKALWGSKKGKRGFAVVGHKKVYMFGENFDGDSKETSTYVISDRYFTASFEVIGILKRGKRIKIPDEITNSCFARLCIQEFGRKVGVLRVVTKTYGFVCDSSKDELGVVLESKYGNVTTAVKDTIFDKRYHLVSVLNDDMSVLVYINKWE